MQSLGKDQSMLLFIGTFQIEEKLRWYPEFLLQLNLFILWDSIVFVFFENIIILIKW
jgi:hypothetical protein